MAKEHSARKKSDAHDKSAKVYLHLDHTSSRRILSNCKALAVNGQVTELTSAPCLITLLVMNLTRAMDDRQAVKCLWSK
jgi:hypothetical protein